MGLPRELRLRSRKEFDAVFRRGRVWNDALLVLRVLPNDLSNNRFGFVTSKRIGGAVVRNRVRRRLREIVRTMALRGGNDLVFSAKKAAADAEYSALRSSVGRLVERAGLVQTTGEAGELPA